MSFSASLRADIMTKERLDKRTSELLEGIQEKAAKLQNAKTNAYVQAAVFEHFKGTVFSGAGPAAVGVAREVFGQKSPFSTPTERSVGYVKAGLGVGATALGAVGGAWLAGAAAGAGIGSTAGGVGAIIGAGIGVAVSALGGAFIEALYEDEVLIEKRTQASMMALIRKFRKAGIPIQEEDFEEAMRVVQAYHDKTVHNELRLNRAIDIIDPFKVEVAFDPFMIAPI